MRIPYVDNGICPSCGGKSERRKVGNKNYYSATRDCAVNKILYEKYCIRCDNLCRSCNCL